MSGTRTVRISELTQYPGDLQDVGFMPLDDGANAYKFSPSTMADYSVRAALSLSLDSAGARKRSVNDKMADLPTVNDFGAIADGVTDNTAAFQAALDSGRSFVVPSVRQAGGAYRIAGTLYFRQNGQQIVGQGHGTRGSRIVFDNGAADCFVMAGTDAVALLALGVCNIQFVGVNKTGGKFCHMEFASNCIFTDLNCAGFWNGVYVGPRCNTTRFSRIQMTGLKSGGTGYAFCQGGVAGVGRSDIIDFSNIACSPDDFNRAERPVGLFIDGGGGSINVNGFRCVNMGRGLWINTNVAGSVAAANIYLFNFGADYPEYEAYRFDTGTSVWGSNNYLFGSRNSCGVYFGPAARNMRLAGGKIAGHVRQGVLIEGSEISLSDMNLGQNGNFPGVGIAAHPGIEVGASATRISIVGGQSGRSAGSSGSQSYGVLVRAGATNVSVIGIGLNGNVTGKYLDESGVATFLACSDTTESVMHDFAFSRVSNAPLLQPRGAAENMAMRVRAKGSQYLMLGNHTYDHLAVGTSADTAVVNRLRVFGAAVAGTPGFVAEGSDADVDILFRAKGTGALRYGSATTAAGAAATHVIRMKVDNGTVYELLARRVD